ncbi:MAG: RluA family pseudouridine synthase [Proteobacteria bacterium]|nr:RluA family pseudouridine synthase [Pseudomonadota bacterium]
MPGTVPCLQADDDLLVLDKPPGLLCVPGRGPDKQDCLSARAQALWPDALIVHRLDQPTSGLVLMARGPHMQRALSKTFAERRVHKRYQAIVAGRPLADGTAADDGWSSITLPIAADWERRPLRVVNAQHGQPSLTRWRALAYDAAMDCTRLELEPVTGRTHQLRVHLAALGHPILGDMLYADAAVQALAPRLLLHACRLAFTHPLHGGWCAYTSTPAF